MKRAATLLLASLVVSHLAQGAEMNSTTVGEGVATGSLPGLVYVSGFEMKIVTLKSESGSVNVLVPSMVSTPIGIGERVSFAGRREKMANLEVINTSGGYVYRPAGKTHQDQINEQIALAQQQMGGSADAVPVRQAITPLVVIALLLTIFSGLSLMPIIFRARRFNIGLRVLPLAQPLETRLPGAVQGKDNEAILVNIRLVPYGAQAPQLRERPIFKLGNAPLDSYILTCDDRDVVFPLRVDRNIDLAVYFPRAARATYFNKGQSLSIEFRDALCAKRFSGMLKVAKDLEARPNNG